MRTNFLWVLTNFTFYYSSPNTATICFEVGTGKSHRQLQIFIYCFWCKRRPGLGCRSLNNSIWWFSAPEWTKSETAVWYWLIISVASQRDHSQRSTVGGKEGESGHWKLLLLSLSSSLLSNNTHNQTSNKSYKIKSKVSPTLTLLQFHFLEKLLLTVLLKILEDTTKMLNNTALFLDLSIFDITHWLYFLLVWQMRNLANDTVFYISPSFNFLSF